MPPLFLIRWASYTGIAITGTPTTNRQSFNEWTEDFSIQQDDDNDDDHVAVFISSSLRSLRRVDHRQVLSSHRRRHHHVGWSQKDKFVSHSFIHQRIPPTKKNQSSTRRRKLVWLNSRVPLRMRTAKPRREPIRYVVKLVEWLFSHPLLRHTYGDLVIE